MIDGEICEYPDSGKVYISKMNKTFQNKKEVPYITDEEDPTRHWNKKYL